MSRRFRPAAVLAEPSHSRPHLPADDPELPGAEAPSAMEGRSTLPWSLPLTTAGCLAITLGLLWDISWHTSIGRDTVWTPAHVTIYIGALLAGGSGAWTVLRTTFAGTPAERARAISLWGLRAPVGSWVQAWGSAAMLTAAGFDAWWHSAYGLDLGIITPAHMALATGMVTLHAGALLCVATPLNLATGVRRQRLGWVFLAVSGTLLLLLVTLLLEVSYPNRQRGAAFYQASCAAYPAVLLATARALGERWSATRAAMVYTVLSLAMLWILPLFPAQPLLAPIFNPIEHMWPGIFPLMLVVPALALDLLAPRLASRPLVVAAPLLGAAFLVAFLAVQWPLSEFLLSPGARNRFFAGDQWYFGVTSAQEGLFPRLGDWRYRFWDDPPGARSMALALAISTVSSAAGLLWGRFLSRVRR